MDQIHCKERPSAVDDEDVDMILDQEIRLSDASWVNLHPFEEQIINEMTDLIWNDLLSDLISRLNRIFPS